MEREDKALGKHVQLQLIGSILCPWKGSCVYLLDKTDFCLVHLAKNVENEHFSRSKLLAFWTNSAHKGFKKNLKDYSNGRSFPFVTVKSLFSLQTS